MDLYNLLLIIRLPVTLLGLIFLVTIWGLLVTLIDFYNPLYYWYLVTIDLIINITIPLYY